MATEDLVVTTQRKASAAEVERARRVAASVGGRYEPRRRRNLSRLRRDLGDPRLYVLNKGRDEVREGEQMLCAHPGLYCLKILDGRAHPLIRALAPGEGAEVHRIVDATLGLAGDALHMAGVLGAQVVGIEASAVLGALLDEGLSRMSAQTGSKWAEAASRIALVVGDAAEILAGMAPDSAEVVYLDPMFDRAASAAPGYPLFRRLARKTPLDARLLAEARRVASRRVVLKIPGASQAPALAVEAPGWNRRVRGQAVDYLVIEGELEAPVIEAPDFGDRRG